MSFDRYRRDLEEVLAHRARVRWCRAIGESAPGPPGELADRIADLAAPEALDGLRAATEDAPAGSLGAWLRVAGAREAVAHRTAEARRETERGLASLTFGGAPGVGWWGLGRFLARQQRAADRDAIGTHLKDGALAADGLLEELVEARVSATPEWLRESRPLEDALNRRRERLAEQARELLSRSEARLEAALATSAPLAGARPERPAVDLPRFRSGAELATEMPVPDLSLARYVLGELRLLEGLRDRLDVTFPRRDGRDPRPGVYVLEPGADVRIVADRIGRPRDYRCLLAGLGRGASAAGLEEGGGLEARLVDPAIGLMYAALFERLALEPAWLERATRRPPEASWLSLGQAHAWQRLRWLAATVDGAGEWPLLEHSARVDAEALEAATGFRQPDGRPPWAIGVLRAAAELEARMAAAALRDRLAERWGSVWFTRPGAGGLLRDLWAVGHRDLAGLLGDLGVGEPSLESLLEQTDGFR